MIVYFVLIARPTILWRFLGITQGCELRGWPSFDRDTFNLITHEMDAVNWPSTRTYQLALSQIAGLSHHYNPHVFKARLLSAGSILGCSRGPYSPSGIDDFLFEIVHSAMIPEMRSFVADGLKALASSKWN